VKVFVRLPTFQFVNTLIRTLRPDLCALYPADTQVEVDRWLGWLLTTGANEYAILHQLSDFRELLQGKHLASGLTQLQWLVYQVRPDVQAAYPIAQDTRAFLAWFDLHGIAEHQLEPWLLPMPEESVLAQPSSLPFGVNLVGYAFGQLGIGEDLRMAAQALMAVGISVDIINFPPGKDIPQNDRSLEAYVVPQGRYAINLFCLTALEHGRYVVEHGLSQLLGRINIGYWPWELSRWPAEWLGLTQLVDEVWVSTRHTYESLVLESLVPVVIMPMAVDVGELARFPAKAVTRAAYALPVSAKLFCFSFDLNSTMARKNPQAVLESFVLAFPPERYTADQVGLVIKVHKPTKPNKAWDALKALAVQDSRIHIIEGTLAREDLLALYHACDAFVSLHRAEGFGRGIAEALQLGLHVITTNYSGNIDFCRPPYANLIDYDLISVAEGDYPYGQGQVWADVDVMHAARSMRQFVEANHQTIADTDWSAFAFKPVGERYQQRLRFFINHEQKEGVDD
jgi:glycosyltransferase involved in cell wall biosynthesis